MSKYLRQRPPAGLNIPTRRLRNFYRYWMAQGRSTDWLWLGKMTGLGAGILGLWLWQWQLLVAIALGAGATAALYRGDQVPWDKYFEEAYRLWHSRYRRLSLAGMGGALTVLVSYGAIALWQSTANPWLTVTLLGQGGLTSLILALMLRRTWQFSSPLRQFETALAQLGDASSVRRLYAIRRLQQLLRGDHLTPEQQQTLKTFLQLSWQQETAPPLREAILNSLRLCQTVPQATTAQPLQLEKSRRPLNLSRPKQAHKPLVKERV
ncbi:hypothetical protein FLX56_21985 [Synechococcus moorigangaii CMS01]|nr:hypothetical protein [Synechococcus moorigangaii CMS01]